MVSAQAWTRALVVALACIGCVRWGTSPEQEDSFGDDAPTDLPAGDDTDTETETETGEPDYPWPEPWPIDPNARVVVWRRRR